MAEPPAWPPPPGWSPPPGGEPPRAWPGRPWEPPPAGSFGAPPAASPPASSAAITAVVFAISAGICFPMGFVALFIGARARRLARENPGRVGGEQMAFAAMLIGGLLAGLNTLTVLAYLVMFMTYGFAHRFPP